ncbi:MAG: T9SS type A sorting domain-containing protein [Brumimicrobium sp.]|nr:T9SS type A sorting domain-containing protein [Brumimicrobium sp.]
MKQRLNLLLTGLTFFTYFLFNSFSLAQYQRPFGPYAPWNIETKYLGVHPNSAYYSQLLWDNATQNTPGVFKLSLDQYTYPVYEVTSGLQQYLVQSGNPSWGNLHGKYIPFDPNWLPATGTDGQIIILDPATGREWDLWQVNFENDIVQISNGNLVQNGVGPGDGSDPGNYWTKENGFSSSRGCGIQYLAMLVRPEEIEEGIIRHALSMPIRNTDGTEYVYPATKLEHPGAPAGVPEGMRFAIDITDEEIEEWLLTVSPHIRNVARIIAVALRDYGWFITDTSGDAHLQFELRFSAPEWDDFDMQHVVVGSRQYPRDLLWGLMTEDNVYALTYDYNGINQVCGGEEVTPIFTHVGSKCSGEVFSLPTVSENGISGSWSPAPDFFNSTEYTFTPDDMTCKKIAKMTVLIDQNFTYSVSSNNPTSCNSSSGSITFTGLSPNTSYYVTSSQGDATASSNGSGVINVTNLPVGVYSGISLTKVGAGACTVNYPNIITLIANNSPALTVSSDVTICKGNSTTITASNYGGASVSWDNGLGSGASHSVSPNHTTIYTASATSGSCTTEKAVTVTVENVVTPTFTIDSEICQGVTPNLPTNSENGISGSWALLTDNGTQLTYEFTPTAGMCASTVTQTINRINVNMDLTVSQNGNILEANEVDATYQWVDCSDNSDVVGATSQHFEPLTSGSYKVILTSTVCPNITDESNCITVATSGLQNDLLNHVFIYPNPTKNTVYISIPKGLAITSWIMKDIQGKVVMDESTSVTEIHVELLSKGMYYLELTTTQGVLVKKLVKE